MYISVYVSTCVSVPTSCAAVGFGSGLFVCLNPPSPLGVPIISMVQNHLQKHGQSFSGCIPEKHRLSLSWQPSIANSASVWAGSREPLVLSILAGVLWLDLCAQTQSYHSSMQEKSCLVHTTPIALLQTPTSHRRRFGAQASAQGFFPIHFFSAAAI